MSLLSLMEENSSIKIPKAFIRAFGLEEAMMLTTLITEYDRWEKEGKAKDGWVFPTVADLEHNLQFSYQRQWSVLEKLEKNGVLGIVAKKRPWKKRPRITGTRRMKINEEAVKNIFLRNEE